MSESSIEHTVRRHRDLAGYALGTTVTHRQYDGEFTIAHIETSADDGPGARPFKLRSKAAAATRLQGYYGTYGDSSTNPYLWLTASADDLSNAATDPAPTIVLRQHLIKAPLGALGVSPGWFCRWSGCDIWFEVLAVFDNSVRVVARNPMEKVSWAYVGDHYAAIDALINHRPVHGHWIDAFRNKNFYDKFHPELENIVE